MQSNYGLGEYRTHIATVDFGLTTPQDNGELLSMINFPIEVCLHVMYDKGIEVYSCFNANRSVIHKLNTTNIEEIMKDMSQPNSYLQKWHFYKYDFYLNKTIANQPETR